MPVRSVPGSASIANPEGGKLFAPSAERNRAVLSNLLEQVAPASGCNALELASGTGQHVTGYATRLPQYSWQPTEADPGRLQSIDAHVAEAGLNNVRPAISLDATSAGWGAAQASQDLIMLSNLLHLISAAEAQCLIREAAHALAIGGRLVIYGPFSRGGELTSPGDERFHASLQAHDPETGYKDDFDLLDWAEAAGLTPVKVIEMPANNLAFVFSKDTL
ncbi:MAG: methyltransferase [Roseobacter sp. MedPE-SW]|nr:MAG: methyltransferase [Roseobacter sp. MedPE-SW]